MGAGGEFAKGAIGLVIDYERASSKEARAQMLKALAELVTEQRERDAPGDDAMKADLIERYGMKCQGCYTPFNHKQYLQLDHILPKSEAVRTLSTTGFCFAIPATTGSATRTP